MKKIVLSFLFVILGYCSFAQWWEWTDFTKTQALEKPKIVTISANGVSFDMVEVKGGSFMMGSDSDDEKPIHKVTVSSFYIGKYEVTQKLWTAIMGSDPSINHGLGLPVDNVDFDMAQKFILKLNQATGKTFRLPTEAEWEYAARGGIFSQGKQTSGGAWTKNNSDGMTHRCGMKEPNELGIYDMCGNVSEWVSDWFGTYSAEAQVDPKGPQKGSEHFSRGGSYKDEPLSVSYRVVFKFIRDYRGEIKSVRNVHPEEQGFRLVLVQ